MPTHAVRRGECIESIAFAHGLAWETVWNHDDNASLRELRSEPTELLVGDQLFVPERKVASVEVGVDARHRFRLRGVPSKIKVRFLDTTGEARTGLYELAADGELFTGELDDGWVEHYVMPNVTRAIIRIEALPIDEPDASASAAHQDDTGAAGDQADSASEPADAGPIWEEHVVQLGHLDPIDTLTGVQGRLANLSYYEGPIDGRESPELELAIVMFQAAQELEPNGILDDQTRAALAKEGSPT